MLKITNLFFTFSVIEIINIQANLYVPSLKTIDGNYINPDCSENSPYLMDLIKNKIYPKERYSGNSDKNSFKLLDNYIQSLNSDSLNKNKTSSKSNLSDQLREVPSMKETFTDVQPFFNSIKSISNPYNLKIIQFSDESNNHKQFSYKDDKSEKPNFLIIPKIKFSNFRSDIGNLNNTLLSNYKNFAALASLLAFKTIPKQTLFNFQSVISDLAKNQKQKLKNPNKQVVYEDVFKSLNPEYLTKFPLRIIKNINPDNLKEVLKDKINLKLISLNSNNNKTVFHNTSKTNEQTDPSKNYFFFEENKRIDKDNNTKVSFEK